jgi:hypothetical protein
VRHATPPVLLHNFDAHSVLIARRVELRSDILRDAKLRYVVGEKTGGDNRVGVYITDQTILLQQLPGHQIELNLH